MIESAVSLDKIVALCKRRGFVFPAADIYSGLNGVYDFGPLGVQLKKNIQDAWLEHIQKSPYEILLFDGSLLGPHPMWNASGHVDNFHDPMVDCLSCKKRYRADEIDLQKACIHCGKTSWTEVREFRLMFQTQVGAVADQASIAYLRPETAQSIFVNFKNVMSSTRVKVPFGIAQIGKAFRNEITPKQFLFRVREFEQMELEFFCAPDKAESSFVEWIRLREDFYAYLGLSKDNIRFRAHTAEELAHYSKGCVDVEYQFPFGWKELEGIANRADYDLRQHTEHSGKDLSVYDEASASSYLPHVVECSVGVGRLFLALLCDAYHEDEVEGEVRVSLKLHPRIAPLTAAVLPLTKKLSEQSYPIYLALKEQGIRVAFDETGSIGKRYRRYDEIGTPLCITFDFDSVQDAMVTIRNRDTLQQERILIEQLGHYIKKLIAGN